MRNGNIIQVKKMRRLSYTGMYYVTHTGLSCKDHWRPWQDLTWLAGVVGLKPGWNEVRGVGGEETDNASSQLLQELWK